MKSLFVLFLVLGLSSALPVFAASENESKQEKSDKVELQWETDLEAALAKAKKEKKPVFALFTGSDWCPWCVKLEGEILSTKEFARYAKHKLILYKADFLRRTAQDEKLVAANQAAAQKYGVKGYPTVYLLNADGTVIFQTGYQRGGAEKYVDSLKKQLKN